MGDFYRQMAVAKSRLTVAFRGKPADGDSACKNQAFELGYRPTNLGLSGKPAKLSRRL